MLELLETDMPLGESCPSKQPHAHVPVPTGRVEDFSSDEVKPT